MNRKTGDNGRRNTRNDNAPSERESAIPKDQPLVSEPE